MNELVAVLQDLARNTTLRLATCTSSPDNSGEPCAVRDQFLKEAVRKCEEASNLAVGIGHMLDYGLEDAGPFETELRSRLAELRARLLAIAGGEDAYRGILACAMVQASADVLANVALPAVEKTSVSGKQACANARALDCLQRHPEMRFETSAQWAERIGCDKSRVRNLQAWKLCRSSLGSAGSRKTVSLAGDHEVAVGANNSVLEELMADQAEDDASDKVWSKSRV